jgi:hypothetical protein
MAVAQQEVEQAKVLAEQGKFEAAVALLSQLIQREPSNIGAWLALSDVVNDPERTEYCLQKVLTLDPGNATALEKLSKSKGGSLSVGAVGGLNQVERDPAPAHTSYDSDSDQLERSEPDPINPQAPADPLEQSEEIPAPEVLAEAFSGDAAELEESQGSEAQREAVPPAPEIPAEAPIGEPGEPDRPQDSETQLEAATPVPVEDAVELDGSQANEAQVAPAASATKAVAQEPVKRSKASRTDLILIGLTVLAGIVLCALVSAALIT